MNTDCIKMKHLKNIHCRHIKAMPSNCLAPTLLINQAPIISNDKESIPFSCNFHSAYLCVAVNYFIISALNINFLQIFFSLLLRIMNIIGCCFQETKKSLEYVYMLIDFSFLLGWGYKRHLKILKGVWFIFLLIGEGKNAYSMGLHTVIFLRF